LTLLLVLSLAGPGLLSAQQEGSHRQGAAGEEEHGAHFHPNHIGLFVGATTQLSEDKGSHVTLGVDYVRRFGSVGQWALGGFGEVIFEDEPEWLFGAAGYFFPLRSLWVQVASGVEFYKDGHGTTEHTETKTSFLLRFGAGYQIELSGFSVTPLALLDLVRDTETLVWGVSLGKGF
jgi:hypothetical protein